MTRLNLLIVTPRYWPLVDDAARLVATLADAFCQEGVRTTVLTAKWDTDWPDTLVHRQAQIVRMPHSPQGGWSTFRYMRSLSRWMRSHGADFDLVYVMNLRQDAYAVIGALQAMPIPVILRAQRAGESGDCHWQRTTRLGRRMQKRCQTADHVIAPSQSTAGELTSSGYPAVMCIRSGAAAKKQRTSAQRYRARVALADANYDLAVAEYAPVAVCVERFKEGRGLGGLVKAWGPVAARWPSAKLWLIGDGPQREPLYEGIVQRGLHHQISMPGSFDDLTEVLQAADVFVSTSSDFGSTQALSEALATGLPIIAADTPDVREIIEHRVEGLLLSPGAQDELSQAIAGFFEEPEAGAKFGAAARHCAAAHCCLRDTVEQHLDLFDKLIAENRIGTS